ncbi:MAG: hypothetical protein HY554_13020 [Elusimicrobia bacterium]|nr:hypothetical protein [Elusimicrobiota bacterium]
MSGKGAIGWLILAVALAVPAFMFWNWWTMLNSRQPEGRRPAPGPVFGGTQMAQNLQNPLTQPPGAPQAVSVAVNVGGAPPAVSTEPARAPGTAGTPGLEGTAAAAAFPPPAEAVLSTAASAGAPSSGTVAAAAEPVSQLASAAAPASSVDFRPRVERDPMLSPMDIKKLAEIELAKEWERDRIRREAEEAARRSRERKAPKKRVLPPIQESIVLQGITAVPGSITAIVNEVIVYAGDVIEVEREDTSARVKVVRITPTTVTFQHGGKRWSESLTK